MAFVKGQSGNPGGRPKSEQALKDLIDLKTGGPEYFVNKLMDFIDHAKDHKVKLNALELMMAYRFGKPRQEMEHSGEIHNSFPILKFSKVGS